MFNIVTASKLTLKTPNLCVNMALTIRIKDERATKILDAAGVSYKLINPGGDLDLNPADYILLEGQSGKDGYPDLWVCKYRLGLSPVVEAVGGEIGMRLQNTAKESNGKEYIGNINREQALRLNLMLGGRTLNTRTGKDFFKLLFFGEVFDGNGEKISNAESSEIAEEITGMRKRNPHRAELFEDYFTKGDDGLILNKNYVLQDGVLVPEYSRVLTSCLMKDKTPGISLVSWLEKSTAQGYPRKNIKSDKLWYFHPRQDSAVRFDAESGMSYLLCHGNPLRLGDGFGARHVREAPQK